MSALVGGIATLLVAVVLIFVGQLGSAASADTRAQMAADAAALAAVAEAAPHGRNAQAFVARRYAEANGAELVVCECDSGTSSLEVEVKVGRATARARAVLDARLLVPAGLGTMHEGLHPFLASSVGRVIEEARGSVRIGSGYRSTSQQAVLWARALARYGSPEAARRWVAPPGHSMHERGLAVDLAGDVERAARIVRELALPLHRPLDHEPWHFELTGSRG
jgi:hypothetical protein